MKGLRILSLFSRERPEWGVGEMSVALGTAKSTVSRIARTLHAEGFLVRGGQNERYRLGLKLWELGSQAIGGGVEFPQRAVAHLVRLVAEINESVQAVVMAGTEAVYVEQIDAPRSIRTHTPLGARFPTYCTATGKVLLAFQPEAVIASVIAAGLNANTERTITDATALRAELERVRKRGFAINKGEWRDDIGGIAAPVYDRTGHVVGAIGVTMPITRFPRDIHSSHSAAVAAAARQFSRELGHAPREGEAAPAGTPARRGERVPRGTRAA